MKAQRHHSTAMLLIGIVVSSIQSASGAPGEDAPQPEPFALTRELIDELTQADTTDTEGSTFRLKGITVQAERQDGNYIKLWVEADPRLNLWRGSSALVSEHLGEMRLIVTSIEDENGQNIYDTAGDKRWGDRVSIYNRGKRLFSGSRSAAFEKIPADTGLKQVSGTIRLSLPIDVKKYVIKANDPESTKPLLEREAISEVELRESGIYIKHPTPTRDFRVTVMGLDRKGERIGIVSRGSAGTKRDNHWYYFSGNTAFDEMTIFIPGEFVDLEIPFTVDIQEK